MKTKITFNMDFTAYHVNDGFIVMSRCGRKNRDYISGLEKLIHLVIESNERVKSVHLISKNCLAKHPNGINLNIDNDFNQNDVEAFRKHILNKVGRVFTDLNKTCYYRTIKLVV